MELEKVRTIYKGQFVDGEWRENYSFINGEKIIVADIFLNARDKYSAVNKLRRMCDFENIDKETIDDDIENGYVEVEEANYYEDNKLYKWYVCVRYSELYGM